MVHSVYTKNPKLTRDRAVLEKIFFRLDFAAKIDYNITVLYEISRCVGMADEGDSKAGLRQAARADAAENALRRMQDIVETEKHRVAPNCATCTMRCGNTDNYDLARLWDAPEELRTLKLRLLAALFTLAQRRSTDRIRKEICDDLFVLAEDWDSSLLSPIVRRAEELCKE